MTLALPESANVDVACFRVHHFALAIGLVRLPLPRVGVAVCKRHGAVPGHGACDKISRVSIAGHGNAHPETMGTAVFLSSRGVRTAEVGFEPVILQV